MSGPSLRRPWTAAFVILVVLAALGVGLYFGGVFVWGRFAALDPQVATLAVFAAVVLLLAARIAAGRTHARSGTSEALTARRLEVYRRILGGRFEKSDELDLLLVGGRDVQAAFVLNGMESTHETWLALVSAMRDDLGLPPIDAPGPIGAAPSDADDSRKPRRPSGTSRA